LQKIEAGLKTAKSGVDGKAQDKPNDFEEDKSKYCNA